MSCDPIGEEGSGLNLYRYASNNPVMRVDPTGMKDETVEQSVNHWTPEPDGECREQECNTTDKTAEQYQSKFKEGVRLVFYDKVDPTPRKDEKEARSETETFKNAAKTIVDDYKEIDKGTKVKTVSLQINSRDEIQSAIEKQGKGAIVSMDIISHGGRIGGTPENPSMYSPSFDRGDYLQDKQITADRFHKEAVIELHGCNTGLVGAKSGIAKDISQKLPDATVIGHAAKSNPNHPHSNLSDYRHGKVNIFKKGQLKDTKLREKMSIRGSSTDKKQ
jgi:uncharacterized protein RhaS with RHS repeats